MWPLEDVAPGVAAELVASGTGLALAATVLLPRVAGVVVLVAVELDGKAVLGPAAVHPPPPGGTVRPGERETSLAQPCQEASFESAEGDANLSAEDLA
jgi:hypothetical protein